MTRYGLQNARHMQAAAEAAIERSPGLKKPTLKRYSWSRLHVDLLDDVRWSLVARRANAPLPIVEAMLIRLENHANRSRPRGYVGDFSADGMAARWNVDEDMIGRIYAALEAPDIGWINQDQLVTFWARNPDEVDETAAERQQRVRDRKRGFRELASQARQGLITEQQRFERELALKGSQEPKMLMASWELSTGAGRHVVTRRDSVTVTARAEQIIKKESGLAREGEPGAPEPGELADVDEAELWLSFEGRQLVTERLNIPTPLADTTIARWRRDFIGDAAEFAAIIRGAAATASPSRPSHFHQLVGDQLARFARDQGGRQLPLPPVSVKRSNHG